jgi:RNA recognition motif-containing protein
MNSRNRDDMPTLRVTNLSEDCTDADMWELFPRFGKVNRWVSLVKRSLFICSVADWYCSVATVSTSARTRRPVCAKVSLSSVTRPRRKRRRP